MNAISKHRVKKRTNLRGRFRFHNIIMAQNNKSQSFFVAKFHNLSVYDSQFFSESFFRTENHRVKKKETCNNPKRFCLNWSWLFTFYRLTWILNFKSWTFSHDSRKSDSQSFLKLIIRKYRLFVGKREFPHVYFKPIEVYEKLIVLLSFHHLEEIPLFYTHCEFFTFGFKINYLIEELKS